MQQLRATTKSLTFPPLSIARYSFIQLSQLGRQWRERKFPLYETVAERDSNPGSLDCESGILPLSYRTPYDVLLPGSDICMYHLPFTVYCTIYHSLSIASTAYIFCMISPINVWAMSLRANHWTVSFCCSIVEASAERQYRNGQLRCKLSRVILSPSAMIPSLLLSSSWLCRGSGWTYVCVADSIDFRRLIINGNEGN